MFWVLIGFSVVVGTAIFAGAGMIWRSNGRLSDSMALLLFATALEIFIAIISDFYIEHHNYFAAIKLVGRTIELVGVVQFLFVLTKRPKNGLLQEHESDENQQGPTE